MNTAPALQPADWVVIGGYFLLMIVIAAYFSRYLRQMKSYFTGGNKIPWWLSGVSFYMTGFTAFVFMSYSEMAYTHGLVAVTMMSCSAIPMLVGAFTVAPLWRRARVTSPVEFIEARFSPALRQILAWSNMPVRVIDNGLRIFATGYFLSQSMGFDLYLGITLCGTISLATAFVGGVWAAMVSDFVQFLVQTAAVLILIPLAIHRIGGVAQIGAGAREGFFMPWTGWDAPYNLFAVGTWTVIIVISYTTNFALVQRYYSVPDERSARNVGILGGVLTLLSPLLFFLPALLAPQFLPDVANAKQIYPMICQTLLPPGMLGIIIAAMFAATMGNLSSEYNVLSSVFTNDVYVRYLNPSASPRRLLGVGMAATLAFGLLPMAISLVLASDPGLREKPLFDLMRKLFDVVLPPIALPILLGLVWRGLTARGAMAGFACGIAAGILCLMTGRRSPPPLPNWGSWTVLATTSSTLLAMIVGSRWGPRGAEECERAGSFFRRLDTPVSEESPGEGAERGPSPFFIVGICTTGVGLLLVAAGVLTGRSMAQTIDFAMGGLLAAAGLAMWRPWKRKVLSLESRVSGL